MEVQNNDKVQDQNGNSSKPLLPAVEAGIELNKEMLVYFIGEKLPMKVKAVNENYAICTRKLNKRQDADLLHRQVETGAYFYFMEAYNNGISLGEVADFEKINFQLKTKYDAKRKYD